MPEGHAGPLHAVDAPARHALERPDQVFRTHGLQVGDGQAHRALDQAIDHQVIVRWGGREAVGHGVKLEVTASRDEVGYRVAARTQ